MARLLVGDNWYEGIASTESYEREFERLIVQAASTIFPGWHLVPFRDNVYSEQGCRRPDYALIDRHYRCWWVVEVEMAHHSLYGHVIPQVEVFWAGEYTELHAVALAHQNTELSVELLQTMMRGSRPGIYVLVNIPCPSWERPLAQYGVRLGVVELFRSQWNELALRINGFIPEPPRESLTLCRRDPLIPSLLRVDSPAALPIEPGGSALFELDGRLTEWVRRDTGSMTYLCPRRESPMDTERTFELQEREDGTLVLVPK